MRTPAWVILAPILVGASGLHAQAPPQQLTARSPGPVPVPLSTAAPLGSSITLGAGVARRDPYCGACSQSMGFTGLVNLSRYVNRAVAVGMESTLWLNRTGPMSAALGSAMGAVTLRALDDVPLSLSGGLGFLMYHQGDGQSGRNTTSGGLGWSGRVGYDALLMPAFALMPYIGYVTALGRLRVGRVEQIVSSLQFGMALRFR